MTAFQPAEEPAAPIPDGTTTLVWADEATAITMLREICALPVVESEDGGGVPLIVYWNPDASDAENVVGYAHASDGRLALADWRITDLQRAWLAAYTAGLPAGSLEILDFGLPDDWEPQTE